MGFLGTAEGPVEATDASAGRAAARRRAAAREGAVARALRPEAKESVLNHTYIHIYIYT